MLTVYRIQDDEKRGPWKPGFSSVWAEDRDPDEYALLVPAYLEMPHACVPGAFCACRSLAQLRRWVRPSEYQALRQHGYRCVRVTNCEVVGESETQLVVRRTKKSKQRAVRY